VQILDKAKKLEIINNKKLELLPMTEKSVFIEMFGEPTLNEKKWTCVPLSNLLDKVQYGTSTKLNVTQGIPCLRMSNITESGSVDISDLKFLNSGQNDQKFLLQKRDLLFNRTNSRELVGKTAIFDLDSEFTYAGYLIRLRTDSKKCDPYFLNSLMNLRNIKRKIRNMAKGSVGQANINAKEIQRLNIIVPPIEMQKKFHIIYQNVRKQIERYQKISLYYKNFSTSLLHEAFLGKLVN